MQLRLRAPTGTRVERTEVMALTAMKAIREEAGGNNVEITLGFVGTQPASYPVNTIHLFTNGPHEAVLNVKTARMAPASGSRSSKRDCARNCLRGCPAWAFSFEAGDSGDADNELRRAHADRGGGERAEHGRQPRIRRKGARRDEARPRACAICNSASRWITRPSTSTLTASAPANWA